MAASSAQGHSSGDWFWPKGLAEARIEARYADVITSDCTGFGKSVRGRDGVRLYRHFDCFTEVDGGRLDEDTLHVLGRTRFKLVPVY